MMSVVVEFIVYGLGLGIKKESEEWGNQGWGEDVIMIMIF